MTHWKCTGILIMLLGGCHESPSSSAVDAVAVAPMSLEWLLKLNDQSTESSAASSIVFPNDLMPHPSADLESYVLRAVLRDATGSLFSVHAELDRLILPTTPNKDSAWSYSSVMRGVVALGGDQDRTPQTHESVERLALGLADSNAGEFYTTDLKLSFDWAGVPDSTCNAQYAFTSAAPIRLQLNWSLSQCPDARSLGALNSWETRAQPVTGHWLDVKSETGSSGVVVTGQLWLAHHWGQLPSIGGAVVLDQLRLILRGDAGESRVLVVSRSKRRSGRGPKTVLGEITDDNGQKSSIELQWQDLGKQVSQTTGTAYPESFRIHSASSLLDLQITPVISLSEWSDALGTLWSGAVQVSGSHSGLGYLDFVPLDDSLPLGPTK